MDVLIIVSVVAVIFYIFIKGVSQAPSSAKKVKGTAKSPAASGVRERKESTPKVSPDTPMPRKVADYMKELEGIRQCFGKLYKSRVSGADEEFHFNQKAEIPAGVYYGLTKFTGETNRNGVKAVAFMRPDGSQLLELDRRKWKQYEKESQADGLKWLGYSDGENIHLEVYRDKVTEQYITRSLKHLEERAGNDAFRSELEKRVEKMDLPEGEYTAKKAESNYGYELKYTGRYHIAGIRRYVDCPFVSFGFARLEPDNKFNPKAVAIYTDKGEKLGYISEKQLADYYAETGGEDNIPLVVEAHYYNDGLYGWLYTFSRNKEEYPDMVAQFIKVLDEMENTLTIHI